MRWLYLLIFMTGGIAGAQCTMAQDFVIRGATVHTASSKGTLKNTDVVVHDGVVVAIGTAVGSSAAVVDANGKELTPGLFGGLTDIGLEEIALEAQTVDSTLNFKSPERDQQWRPELDVTLAFNPRSIVVPISRIEGVTWTVLVPNSADTIIGGQGSAVVLDGRYEAALPGSRSLFVQMGAAGARVAGGSRAAEYMLLEQAIHEARAPRPIAQGALLHAAGREALTRYLTGGRVVFQVDRAADILGVVAFADRNGIKPVILGGDEAWLVAKVSPRPTFP